MTSGRLLSRIVLLALCIAALLNASSQVAIIDNSTISIDGFAFRNIENQDYNVASAGSMATFYDMSYYNGSGFYLGDIGMGTDVIYTSGLNATLVEISLVKKEPGNVDALLACDYFVEGSFVCQNWSIADFDYAENETHVVFIADSFTAIAGHIAKENNLKETLLDVWPQTIIGKPYGGKAAYPGNVSYIYSNFTDGASGDILSDGFCTATETVSNYTMIYDSAKKLFTYAVLYDNPGNYSFGIYCCSEGYYCSNKSVVLEISPLISANDTHLDNDGDGYSYIYDCNDNNPNINPGKVEILYNGVDDDCSSATLDYFFFDISTNKLTYGLGESVQVTIRSYNNSDAYITINSPSNISYVYIYANDTYPKTLIFSHTNNSGNYSIEGISYYNNYTISKEISFGVENNLVAIASANQTEAFKNNKIGFFASASGGTAPYTYSWNFDDGTVVSEKDLVHAFNSSKTYNVLLRVKDYFGNQRTQTLTISVIDEYKLLVKVVDNNTNAAIKNIKVKLDSDAKYTNSSGSVEFRVALKTYDIKLSHANYSTYSAEIKINGTHDKEYRLIREITGLPPQIFVQLPSDNSEYKNRDVEFSFYVIDDTDLNCTLYTSFGDSWWTAEKTFSNLVSNKEAKHTLSGLKNGEYYWKIECIDKEKKSAETSEYSFTIKTEEKNSIDTEVADINETSSAVQSVYDLLPDLDSYTPDQKRVLELLDIYNVLEESKVELDRANRDMFNLRYRKDLIDPIGESEKIIQQIAAVKDKTPRSVTVEDKVEFIKYVDDKEAEELINKYIDLKNTQLSSGDRKKIVDQNKLLQKKITVSTESYNVRIEYLSGRIKELTLISKKSDYNSVTNGKFVEFIPDEIIGSAELSVITASPAILQDGRIFEIPQDEAHTLSYSINKKILLSEIPKMKSLLITLDEQSEIKEGGTITGFALFNTQGSNNKIVFYIEILVIVILAGIYISYQFRYGGAETVNGVPETAKSKEPVSSYNFYGQGFKAIDSASSLLENGNISESSIKFSEAKYLFNKMSDYHKSLLYPKIIHCANKINIKYMHSLIDDCYIRMAEGNIDGALILYQEISEEYALLDENSIEKIYPKICELIVALEIKKLNCN
ncbi:MAG: PKD domain-containing protein [archaeon]